MAGLLFSACTKEKTDYRPDEEINLPDNQSFKEAAVLQQGNYVVHVEVLDGIFYTGYNAVRVKINNKQTNKEIKPTSVTFLPIQTNADASHAFSAPHRYQMLDNTAEGYFSGYAIFTKESSDLEQWTLYMSFTDEGQTYALKQVISVKTQVNKNLNMVTFTGRDNEEYVLALRAPVRPHVGENVLQASIYKYNKPTQAPSGAFPDPSQFSYSIADGYNLQLDPRMPDPSMGNHSSPNNKDLMQQQNGIYQGLVNYTMTGNWTLNFILTNPDGKIIKGTVVPTDFTPGVEGKKSDLHIDILF